MAANLILCLNQTTDIKPFVFTATNTRVYSFEEALYHCFLYWKQSTDEYFSYAFIDWVEISLGLHNIASKIKLIRNIDDFKDKMLMFFSITDFFNQEQMESIKREFTEWEKRFEWEKLKEQGDYFVNSEDFERALVLYSKALVYEENTVLLNNIAVTLMHLGRYEDAVYYFERARLLEPSNINWAVNSVEAMIWNGEYDRARKLINTFDSEISKSDAFYLNGELQFMTGGFLTSIPYFEKAIETEPKNDYIFRLADVYVKLRQFKKALEITERAIDRNSEFYIKQSEIYFSYNDIPTAIKSVERALVSDKNNVELWTLLAKYHRLDYDLLRAQSAITKANMLSPRNAKVKLEHARIRKAQGKIKDYQQILNSVLNDFKLEYRDITELGVTG